MGITSSFCSILTEMKMLPFGGQFVVCREAGFVECQPEIVIDTHDFPGALHLGAEHGIDTG